VEKRQQGRRRRRELERRAEKLLRKAPQRQPGEGAEEYEERLSPWFRQRAGEGSDSDELWATLRSIIEREQGSGSRPLSKRARKILDQVPRPLPGETPSEYTERAHGLVMGRAEREGGPELVQEVQRLMGSEVRATERDRQEAIARGKYPVAQVVRLPYDVTAKLTMRAAVLIDDNRVDLGELLENYARRVGSSSMGPAERPLRGGYPIGGSTVVFAWIPKRRAFHVWERGELPGEEEQPVFEEDEIN
jgi:hypothetical protein